jgi:hypothetical protein
MFFQTFIEVFHLLVEREPIDFTDVAPEFTSHVLEKTSRDLLVLDRGIDIEVFGASLRVCQEVVQGNVEETDDAIGLLGDDQQ